MMTATLASAQAASADSRCAAPRRPLSAPTREAAAWAPAPRALADFSGVPLQVQAKSVGSCTCDSCEREADRVADELRGGDRLSAPISARPPGTKPVMRQAENEPRPQRGAEEDEDDDIVADESGMPKQAPGTRAAEGPVTLPSGAGRPLAAADRDWYGSRLGHDFSSVRIHSDGEAARVSAEMGARAFTTGSEIYFGAGRYQPSTQDGRALLAHELTHVVQQQGASGPPVAQRQDDAGADAVSGADVAAKGAEAAGGAEKAGSGHGGSSSAGAAAGGSCPQGKQKRVVHSDCATSGPLDRSAFIRRLDVNISRQVVTATWGARTGAAARTTTYACSPNPRHTPRGPDVVGVKCSVNHTNMNRDGMAWFTGFDSQGMRIGFHDSQRVGPGIHSHGCVRVLCGPAQEINRNTWSGVTRINVT